MSSNPEVERWVVETGDEWWFSPARRLRPDERVPSPAVRTYPTRRAALEALIGIYEGERVNLMRGLGRAKAMLRRAKATQER